MRLEDQVTSLELSKKLKTLGVKQESVFTWNLHHFENGDDWVLGSKREDEGKVIERIAAFSVAELGEMLPASIEAENGVTFILEIDRWGDAGNWQVSYRGGEYEDMEHALGDFVADDKTLHDAAAKMLIHLIEQGLLQPPPSQKGEG